MNKGRIVQIGTAREIYQEPATRFVAEFIGQSIWFSGHVRRRGRSRGIRDAMTASCFPSTAPANAVPGSGLSIRPEHVHLPPRPDDVIRIPATVTNVEFFGAELIVSCRLESGRVIRIPIRSDDQVIPDDGRRRPARHLAGSMQGGRR